MCLKEWQIGLIVTLTLAILSWAISVEVNNRTMHKEIESLEELNDQQERQIEHLKLQIMWLTSGATGPVPDEYWREP